MALFGLIGYPLGHSLSPAWFTERFITGGYSDYQYHLYPMPDISGFYDLLEAHPAISGLNVTIPYKEAILSLLSDIDPVAREIGAVNTLTVKRFNGKIVTHGYNTDAGGFLATLPEDARQQKALVLGTGGSSKAVAWALRQRHISVTFVSREKTGQDMISYSDIDHAVMAEHTLIINTTPAGMFPHTEACPGIPYRMLTTQHLLYDLVYNPAETLFVRKGKQAGAAVMNGLAMLHQQAELAYRIFTGT